MTFGGGNFSDFPEHQIFQKMPILVHFEVEDEGTAGTLLVVFIDARFATTENGCQYKNMFAVMHWQHS